MSELEGVKPLLRGVFHQYAFVVSLGVGIALVAAAPETGSRIAMGIFAVSVCTMFGVSALYHRITWRPGPRRWMRRLDHAAIYLLIAGSYTPFSLIVLEGTWRTAVLSIVWSGATVAILFKFLWVDAPKWVAAAFGIGLGWVGMIAAPRIFDVIGIGGLALILVGGLFYTVGAVVYARQWPDPVPHVFGYHELWHAMVIVAAACQYAAIAFYVLPEA